MAKQAVKQMFKKHRVHRKLWQEQIRGSSAVRSTAGSWTVA
jgi:hypothetical protein